MPNAIQINHIEQRQELENLLELYKAYVPFLIGYRIKKLTLEMIKISDRLELLNEMKFDELLKPIAYDYDTKQSKINFY